MVPPLYARKGIFGHALGHKYLLDPSRRPDGTYYPGYSQDASTDARFVYGANFGLGAESVGNISLCAPNCADQFKGSGRIGRCTNICTSVVGGSGSCSELCAGEFNNYMGRRAKCISACEGAMRGEPLLTREGGGLPLDTGGGMATFLPIALLGVGAVVLISVLKKKKTAQVRANRRRRSQRRALRSYR